MKARFLDIILTLVILAFFVGGLTLGWTLAGPAGVGIFLGGLPFIIDLIS